MTLETVEQSMPVCGGKAAVQAGDEIVDQLLMKIHRSIEEKLGKSYQKLKVVQYRTQVVAGLNYFLKIHAGGDEYLHATVWQRPSEVAEPELTNVQVGKTLEDSL